MVLKLEKILILSPIDATTNVPGRIPIKDVKKTILNLIPKIAGARLTIQKGNIGKKRKNNRYLNWFRYILKLKSGKTGLDFNFSIKFNWSPALTIKNNKIEPIKAPTNAIIPPIKPPNK